MCYCSPGKFSARKVEVGKRLGKVLDMMARELDEENQRGFLSLETDTDLEDGNEESDSEEWDEEDE